MVTVAVTVLFGISKRACYTEDDSEVRAAQFITKIIKHILGLRTDLGRKMFLYVELQSILSLIH